MIILAVFLVFVLFFGLGFALNWLWFVSIFFLFFWLIGIAMGRGESAGHHRFYRW